MKIVLKRLLSLSLFFLMSFSIVLAAVLTASADDSKAVDPKKIDKVIIDFRNEADFTKNSQFYIHTPTASEPDPDLGGKYTWDAEKQALKLDYHVVSGNQYTVMTMMQEAKIVTNDHKFLVVVYMAKTDKPYRLSIWNTPKKGFEAVFAENGSDTNGKWVISEPVDISGTSNGATLLSRFTVKSPNSLRINTTDTNAEFYIKEYGFFKSADDARAYYSAIDIEKSPSIYTDTPTGTTASDGKNLVSVSFTTPEEPQSSTSDNTLTGIKPIIIDLSTQKTLSQSWAAMRHYEDGTGGAYEFVTLPDGTQCMKINYLPHSNFSPYRIMPYITWGPNYISDSRIYMRVTYMTDSLIPGQLTIRNNANSGKLILSNNTAISNGEWIRTNATDITAHQIHNRFNIGTHCTLEFTNPSDNANIYIKEIAFFASAADAYAYYGDSESMESIEYSAMSFDENATGTVDNSGANYGINKLNTDTGALDITYASSTNKGALKYMAKVKFKSADSVDLNHRYVRVLYSADNPDGVTDASMFFINDKTNETTRLAEKLNDTNGKYVLSETVYMPLDSMSRFAAKNGYSIPIHNSLVINTGIPGGTYSIKGVYFFPTRLAAESFIPPSNEHTLKINGNDISKYQIVVDDNAPANVVTAANEIAHQIKVLTSIIVPVVTDEAPLSDYEIVVGQSSRPLSTAKTGEYAAKDTLYYFAYMEGNTLVVSSVVGAALPRAVDVLLESVFYKGRTNIVKDIEIPGEISFAAIDKGFHKNTFWSDGEHVDDPEVFTEDFDVNDGYFNEDNGEKNFKYTDGSYTVNAKDFASSYIHVFEKNISYKATLMYTSADNGVMGIMARQNSADAWIKAGYDFDGGCWYIESRDGKDFYLERNAEKKAEITAGTAYELTLYVDGERVTLSVNGDEIFKNVKVSHFSPGRVGLYAENAAVSFDDVELILLSGEGEIWRNVYYTRVPGEIYREGGTITEMSDGSLLFYHNSGFTMKSTDNGITWEETTTWTDTYGYPSILRLNDGKLLKIATIGNNKISQTSSDDGKTWIDGGIICARNYKGSSAVAVNMNDKVTQSATTGRIFYCQNYESASTKVEGRNVFCEYYYSDDNGATWTKSETDSWTIAGNESEAYFGENKLIECADGTIRMYCSWNEYGTVVYSDSADGGKTFGPLVVLEDWENPHSSMQIVRDPHGLTPTTYYMVWINQSPETNNKHTPRSRLCLAYSIDGKNWVDLGEVTRWESTYNVGGQHGTIINHIVDPFVYVTKDYVYAGTGFSEGTKIAGEAGPSAHQGQRQHIYAIKKDTLPDGTPLNNFNDIKESDSYYNAVNYAVFNRLFTGMSATEFQPLTTMNRAMFVTVLGRLEGVDIEQYNKVSFTDVISGSWYASYVEWAAANSIVNGIGNGLFGIDGSITVEQACTILKRYNGGSIIDDTGIELSDFADSNSVSSWAIEGVEWALANGIYVGENGLLKPTEPANRALVATMFYNYVNVFGK